MGVRSTGSHPTTTKADGHLLEYFRQNFGAGGGGTMPSTTTRTFTQQLVVSLVIILIQMELMFTEHTFLHQQDF